MNSTAVSPRRLETEQFCGIAAQARLADLFVARGERGTGDAIVNESEGVARERGREKAQFVQGEVAHRAKTVESGCGHQERVLEGMPLAAEYVFERQAQRAGAPHRIVKARVVPGMRFDQLARRGHFVRVIDQAIRRRRLLARAERQRQAEPIVRDQRGAQFLA
ncbi:MAG: hypothetical protein HY782_20375, partial [Chloroflexi bacterium]|nr:hypothetical protein [Chloroflexota bacterium]